jgi:hypothetical protein
LKGRHEMKVTAQEKQILRHAAAVADAQKDLVALEKRRREGRLPGMRTAGPLLGALFVSMMVVYFSVLAITSDRELQNAPVFLSGDIERSLPRG